MEIFSSYTFLIASSLVIIISFFFNIIAKKTNIPSVLMLIALGAIIQQTIDQYTLEEINLFPVLELFGIVGLIMIVLEAALDLELKRDRLPIILKSFAVAIISLVTKSISIAYVVQYFFSMEFVNALLYAVPLSIMSSAIIIPSVANLSHAKKEFMIYESTFADILGIMMFYFIIESVNVESNSALAISISLNVLITLVVSVVVSYGLVFLFQKLKSNVKLFFFVAILILIYSIGKIFHLSSLLMILVFGIILLNRNIFIRGFLKKYINEDSMQQVFHNFKIVTIESAFVVRTFFFVIFGMTLTLSALFDLKVLLISMIILGIIYSIRVVLLYLFIGKDMFPQLYMVPRGLITILLFYAIPVDFQIPDFNNGILLFIIIVSSIIMAISLIFDKKNQKEICIGQEAVADSVHSDIVKKEN